MGTFDFEKYKAIIDYISNSSGVITTSIDDLLKGTIEMRKNSSVSIVRYNTQYEIISIGSLSYDIQTLNIVADGDIFIDPKNGITMTADGESDFSDGSVVPKSIDDKFLEYVSNYFLLKTEQSFNAEYSYVDGITFKNDDIPSVGFFSQRYYTNKDEVLTTKLITSIDSTNNQSTAVTKQISESMSGVNISNKTINIKTKTLSSNLINISNNGEVSSSSVFEEVVVGSMVGVNDAPTSKSMLTRENISRVCVKKDLSNIPNASLVQDNTGSSTSLKTLDELEMVLLDNNTIKDNTTSIEKECTPRYSSSSIFNGLIVDSKSKNTMGDIEFIDKYFSANRGQYTIDDISKRFAYIGGIIPLGLSLDSDEYQKINGSTASSIGLIFKLVAARLERENKDLFMTSSEYASYYVERHIYMNSLEYTFNIRPMVKNSNSSIGVVDDIVNIMKNVTTTESTGSFSGGWQWLMFHLT